VISKEQSFFAKVLFKLSLKKNKKFIFIKIINYKFNKNKFTHT